MVYAKKLSGVWNRDHKLLFGNAVCMYTFIKNFEEKKNKGVVDFLNKFYL